MKFILYILLFLQTLAFAEEVSVFGAGNLEASAPYGLTESEKIILKNKNNLTKFDRQIDLLKSDISDFNEKIDGLQSLVNGDSIKLNSTIQDFKSVKIQFENLKSQIDVISTKQKTHEDELAELDTNLKLLQVSFNKFVKQIDKDYVTKKEFNELVSFINKQVSQQKTQIKNNNTEKNESKHQILKEAKELVDNKQFSKAISLFEYLIQNNYRPAESNFYLGEIYFNKKSYQDAISHYKTSMMLYDKAKYIPKLLLHSAQSFEKINDLSNAKIFYGTLVDVYADTQEAKIAQEKLSKIK